MYGCGFSSVHLPVITTIATATLRNCPHLVAVIMDEITEAPSLGNTNAFQDTPIASGTGYIYVPDALVNTVKAASNWSNFAAQIKGMSDCPQEYKTLYGIN